MTSRPKRVLQILAAMNRGGVETWLMHVLREVDPRRVRMDFLVHTSEPALYDAEIRDRRSRLLPCTASTHSPLYSLRIAEILRESGPYDVVHSHVHHFSGYLLRIAHRARVPMRLAHSHSDTSSRDRRAGWLRRRYLRLTESWIQAHATHMIGASCVAARSLFGEGWLGDSRSRLLHCGIDLKPFRNTVDRSSIRGALGIGDQDFVLGHVGRLDTPKNHAFLAEIAAEVVRRRPDARLVLIGDGPLRRSVAACIEQLGIGGRTVFAGDRPDVPSLLSAMDVFVFPSLWEGLPLTVLEAQAAGLPCVISDVISSEVDIVPRLIHRVSLELDSAGWADAVLAAARVPAPDRRECLSLVENSDFDIRRSTEELCKIYAA